jgi:hypothetical protein
MNYSRRQLEAFGEPLGESATRLKPGGRIYGGGGGSGPAQTQTQTVDLPEWAQPHAKKILAKGEALSEAPYQKYGGDRTALFTDLQKGAMEGARTMGPASQLGTATGLAGDVGRRAMDTNYQAGQFSGGQFGGNEAQQYMNPYMQNVVDIQQREAQRQADIAGTQRGAQAVKSGAFGGSRQAIVDAEAARNLATQKGDIQAQGLNQSYQQAMAQFNADQARRMQADQLGEQSRQYGAGLGLQGLQTGLQAAGTLGQLGGQQFQQGMDINKLRSAYGGMEQALNQRGLDVKYQDFMNEENYPYKQVGFYSDLLRGTPTGSSSVTNMYQPQGSGLQDIAGLGMGMYGLSKFMAEGGEVKTYAGDQGSVTSEESVNSIIDKLGPEQLQQARENAMNRRDMDTVTAIDKRLAELAQSKSMYAGLGGAFDQIPADQQENIMSAANGGIVAFANGGSYLDQAEKSREEQLGFIDQATTMPSPEDRRKDIVAQRDMIKGLYEPSVLPKYLEETKAERANLGKNMDEARGLGALLAAAEMIGAKNIREGAKASTKAFVGEVSRVAKENKEADRLLRQSEIQLATASELYNNGMTDKAIVEADKGRTAKARAAELKAGVAGDTSKMYAQLQNTQLGKDATIAAANISAKAHRDTANKPGQLERMVSDYEQRLGRKLTAEEYVQATEKIGAASYGAKYTGPDKSLEQATGIQKLVKDDPRVGAVELELLMAKGDPVKTAQLEQKLATITAEVQQEVINRAKNIKDKSGAPADASRVGRTPPPAAIDMLKKDPSADNRRYFDQTFGPGAAAKVLGG